MIAELVHYQREESNDGSIFEMVIWKISPSLDRPHGVKYRLHYGSVKGVCYVRYDNKLSKGDHKHIGDREQPYQFESIEKLIADFKADVTAYKRGWIR
jgi:hypothetical protein